MKSILIYDKIKKFKELIKEEKNNYLNENIKDFDYLMLILNNDKNISDNIKIIKNYNDFINDINDINNTNDNNKYFILYEEKVKKILKSTMKISNIEEGIFYFTYKDKSYLFFSFDRQNIFQLIYLSNNFWKLIEYDDSKNINIIEVLKEKINRNKNKDLVIKQYLHLKYNDFKYFYLINENWIKINLKKDQDMNNYQIDNIWPQLQRTGFGYEYRIYFGLIETNDEIINQLIKIDKICKNDLLSVKIFFVYGDIKYHRNLYFGLLDKAKDNNIIYFYLFEKDIYKAEFVLEYNDKNIMINEIDNYILREGIEIYLHHEMKIDFTKKEKQNLMGRKNNKKIGKFICLNENINVKIFNPVIHSRSLESSEGTFYFNGVIQCLVNIGPLKELFLNIYELNDKKIIQEKKIITMNFYKLMNYMWNYNQLNNNDEGQSIIFLTEIQTLSQDLTLFNNIKLLIEFILLSMHYEQKLNDNIDLKIDYKIDEIKKDFYKFKNSFINDLFFFELGSADNCLCNNNFISTHYMLSFDDDKLYKQLINQTINIETLLSHPNIKLPCKFCNKFKKTKITFKSFPKILIIYFQQKKDNNIKFKYKMEIDLKKYSLNYKDNARFELISMIKIGQKKEIKTYCKSSKKDIWYKYTESIDQQKIEKIQLSNDIENYKIVPYLLIYQKI